MLTLTTLPPEAAAETRTEKVNPDRIFLAPTCCVAPDVGRMWAADASPWPCPGCPRGQAARPVEYLRADMAKRLQNQVRKQSRGWMRHAATQIIAAEAKAGTFDEPTMRRIVAALFQVPRIEPRGQ